MPCCAGVEGGCATGACQDALFRSPKKEEKEKEELCGSEAAFKSHDSKRKRQKSARTAAADPEADHCDSDKDGKLKGGAKATTSSAQEAAGERPGRAITAHAIAAPCAKDCCAVASPSAQSRRGRDAALASLPGKAPPDDFVSLSLYLLNLQPDSSAHLRQLKARAPPRTSSSSLT